MCGIIGYIGSRKAAPILIEGLKKLEYRGYDSAGIATLNNGELLIKKGIGKIDEIEKRLKLDSLEGTVGISHCRWATHGKITENNAHPHLDCSKRICVVHNGIIENYDELKKRLSTHKFISETDSEVIAHLIEEYYHNDLKEAILNAVKELKGSYALAILSTNEDVLFAVRKETPLVIGVGKNENFIASDLPPLLSHTKKVIYLDNYELALLTRDYVKIFNFSGEEIKKLPVEVEFNDTDVDKCHYPHYMLKEIYEQPKAIENTINGRIINSEVVLDIDLSHEEIKNIDRIVMVACGTSWHAALIGEFMFEELIRVPVEVEYASEFRYRNPILDKNTLVIAISQSGETADTLAALREAKNHGAKTLAICNVEGSSIAREADHVIYTKAGPEIGVASTKAFTSQLAILYLLVLYFGKIRGKLTERAIKERISDLRKIPLLIESVLSNEKSIVECAEIYYKKNNSLYLGRGINYPIALEGALKLKEVSYVHAEGYPAAEMKHGPIALIDEEMPVVVIATYDNRTYEKVLINIEEVKSRGGRVIAIATNQDLDIKEKVDHVIYIPKTSYILTPILAVIPLQLFAYHIAIKRGCDVDKPRNLAKSVTVE